MEQNTAENEAHVSSTMEPLGKMQKKLIRNIKYKVIPSTAYHYCNNILLYYYHYYYYYYIIITENSQNIPIQILRRRTRHNNKTYRIEIVNVKLKIHGFTLLVT